MELERIWDEMIRVQFEVLPQHFLGGTEENHGTSDMIVSDIANILTG
jgi:hypothetical protein